MFDPAILVPAIGQSFRKLDPRLMVRNPVMFVVEIVAALTTILFLRDLVTGAGGYGFSFQINLWLWFTVLFANFAEAVAEGRGKAQAATLRKATHRDAWRSGCSIRTAQSWQAGAGRPRSKPGDVVLVEAGDLIPSDGEVIEGVASVNEAAITGESAPVIRESGGDRSAVTGGTLVLSDWIKVRITAAPGLDLPRPHDRARRRRGAAEDAERDRAQHPARRHDDHLRLRGRDHPELCHLRRRQPSACVVLVALFVTLIPTTIGALLSAIGIAGMDRLVRFNVLAMSGRAVEAAGDVDTLLLDKTGTITLGNRQATEFIPLPGVSEQELADAAQLASLSGRDAGRPLDRRAGKGEIRHPRPRDGAAQRALHPVLGADPDRAASIVDGSSIRKGAVDAVLAYADGGRTTTPATRGNVAVARGVRTPLCASLQRIAERIAKSGGTPLAVAKDGRLLGVIHLKDIIKGGIRERFAALRQMGIRTVMITGDNPLTAAAIAAESGRRRFPRAGDAGDQAQADPRRAGAGQAGRDVRRRHQRRAGPGAGRCRRGDEHRHDGGARGRQHGRSRQRPDQADRDRRDRQAAADDARRADDVLDRQRRREIFRDHPGDVRRLLSAAAGAQHHASGDAAERHPVGDHLQRADHHRADPAGAARRRLPARSAPPASCGAIC